MTEQQRDLIAVDSDVVGGQAPLRDTRIPVSVVLDCLATGMSEEEILGQYPRPTVEGIRAAAVRCRAGPAKSSPLPAWGSLDANRPYDLTDKLVGRGHDVDTVAGERGSVQQGPRGRPRGV